MRMMSKDGHAAALHNEYKVYLEIIKKKNSVLQTWLLFLK